MNDTLTIQTSDAAILSRDILNLIFELRNVAPSASDSADGADYHAGKVADFVRRGLPITLVLPAFPAKSSNPEKTLGILPDFGEVLALQRLNSLCAEIAKRYAPGAQLVVCSDGRVFSDLVQVSDHAVSEYGRGIRRIIAEHELSHIATYDLDDVFASGDDYAAMRRELVERFAEPLESLRERVKADPDTLQLFNGIHRFLFEDLVALNPEMSRTKIRNWSKELAYATIQRSNAWSNLVESRFPEAVRLSIHPQPTHSRKIGVRLLPSSNMWRTPWHSTVLFDGVEHRLVRRREAEEMGAVLVATESGYPYFSIASEKQRGECDARHAFN
ncbi:MAG: L-tyrosine/L-tryptophan isonitrile synthase family protein [Proteobacteria bacterium]|nr:L-tyrosine/L-tryptophan isonitrile synthase family protein [Pseudomonadota bacterium]